MVEESVRATVKTAWKKIKEKEGPSTAPGEGDEKKALNAATTAIVQKVLRNMKSYEDLLEKYLHIPDFVILPEDRKHDVTKSKEVSEADMLNTKIQTQLLETEVSEVTSSLDTVSCISGVVACSRSYPPLLQLQTAKVIRSLEEELEQYEKIKQSFSDVEALMDLVEARLHVDVQPTELKKSMKNIAGLITDKNN